MTEQDPGREYLPKKEIEMDEIVKIKARQILDSRGEPTVRTTVTTARGVVGCASVPAGASTGKYEATELRDGSDNAYFGRGVTEAVRMVNEQIFPTLEGIHVCDQSRADFLMIALDGTENKSKLGANAILSVSLAVARAAAATLHLPLYRYLGGIQPAKIPVPMLNVLNGGKHADNNCDIQEFMIVPSGFDSFGRSLRAASEIYHTLGDILLDHGLNTGVGDEGGYAPDLGGECEAIEYLIMAIEKAGYTPGEDVFIALDAAASGFYQGKDYYLPKRKKTMSADELIGMYEEWRRKYPIISIEDGLSEEDAQGWQRLNRKLGDLMMLVGDDLYVTSERRICEGGKKKLSNAVLLKPNQIGTLTEVCAAVRMARIFGMSTVFSHRSGETADTSLADIAVAFGGGYFKSGAPARAERTEKYNRMAEIEDELFGAGYGNSLFF